MGYEVLFLEWSETYEACYDPSANSMTSDPKYGLRFINETFKPFDLQTNWAYLDEHTNTWYGQTKQKVLQFVDEADVVINLSGVTALRSLVQNIQVRIFLDTDPLFTQIRIVQNENDRAIAAQHTHHFTYAENIHSSSCSIPDAGFAWKTTRQPMVLNVWPEQPPNPKGRLTTVMQWDSYKTQSFGGVEYGMKSKSFGLIEELPSLIDEKFEVAMGSATAPKENLTNKGWHLRDPLKVTETAFSYQKFIANSKAEFTIAKHGYVASRSGWFSERSAAYLASGRPVITQETGFSDLLPTGNGLYAFETLEQAIAAINQMNRDYPTACKNARNLASKYFDSEYVLTEMLSQI